MKYIIKLILVMCVLSAIEQILIDNFGLGGKPGQSGQLLNKINSIRK